MTMTSVTVRVDDATKKQATDIVEDLGLDLSSVTRAFYRQIVRENRIPLSLSRQPIPAETLDALDEVRERRRRGDNLQSGGWQDTELPRNGTCARWVFKEKAAAGNFQPRAVHQSGAPGGTRTHTVQILRLSPLPIGIQGPSHNLTMLTQKNDFAKSLSSRRFAPYSTP